MSGFKDSADAFYSISSQVIPYGAPPDVYPAIKKNVSSCSMGRESGSLWGRFRLRFVLTFLSARIRCDSLRATDTPQMSKFKSAQCSGTGYFSLGVECALKCLRPCGKNGAAVESPCGQNQGLSKELNQK